MEDSLRFEWGICSVCGVFTDESDARFRRESSSHYNQGVGKVLRTGYAGEDRKFVVNQRSMLCEPHQEQWRSYRGPQNYHEWVRTQPDSHLLFHEFEMECPVCIPCPKCFDRLPMDGDYLCEVCRYG